MHEKHKKEYFNKILEYITISEDKKKNESLLSDFLEAVDEDVFTKYMAELLNHLQMISKDKKFTEVFCFDRTYHDEFLINEVLGTAANLNRKARVFYMYYLLRKYDVSYLNHGLNNEFNLDEVCAWANLSSENKRLFDEVISEKAATHPVYDDADKVLEERLLRLHS